MPKDKNIEPEIRKIYNPDDEEKEVIKFIYDDRYEAMKTSEDRLKADKIWDKAEKQWEALREDKAKDTWQSNHITPETFSVVETAMSEMIKQNIKPIILPRGKEDEARARVMSYIWDYAWEVSDSDTAVYNILKDALMFGTGIGQEYYWKDRRMVGSITVNKDKKEEYKEHETFAYDDVILESVKLQDFFVDEKARGFTGPFGARDCIRRYIMNIDDFKLFFQGDIWDPLGNAQYVTPGGDVNYYEYYKPPKGIDNSKEVEVLWYWSTKPKDRLVIVANDVLIVDRPNPYKHKSLPFVRCVDVKRVHRFYGKGEPEILESIHDEATTLRRMIIDRNHLDIDKMFFVSRQAALDDEDLIARPHGMIPTDDVASAKAVEYGDIPRSVELSLKYLEDDGTIATGINPRAQAMPTAGTATEAAILKESTLRRIELKLWLMKKEFLIQMARLRVANILQFYPQPKLEEIVGEQNSQTFKDEMARLKERGLITESGGKKYRQEFKQIRMDGAQFDFGDKGQLQEQQLPGGSFSFFTLKPDYFVPVSRGGYDIKFDATVSIDVSKPLMQSKMLELFDRFSQIALRVPGTYDIVKLGDMVLKTYDKDPNDLKPDEVVANEQTQFLQTLIELAGMENQMMIQGKPLPPTPNSSPVHTRSHIEFMQSPPFMGLPNESPIIKIFVDHVMGEILAQQMRQTIGGVGGAPPPEAQNPNQGGPQAQGPTNQGGISNGVTNRPGGMAKPAIASQNVRPAFNNGGGR